MDTGSKQEVREVEAEEEGSEQEDVIAKARYVGLKDVSYGFI